LNSAKTLAACPRTELRQHCWSLLQSDLDYSDTIEINGTRDPLQLQVLEAYRSTVHNCAGLNVQSRNISFMTIKDANQGFIAEDSTPETEQVQKIFARWEHRVKLEVKRNPNSDPRDFFDRWEEAVVDDGWDLGKARESILAEMYALGEEAFNNTFTYLDAHLVAADWFYHNCCSVRPGRRGGNTVDVLLEILVQSQGVASEIVCLIKHGHSTGAWARWRALYELTVCSTFIGKFGERAAQRYKSAHIVQGFHDTMSFPDKPKDIENQTWYTQLTREYQKIDSRYGPLGNNPSQYWWAAPFLDALKGKPGISHLARAVGGKIESIHLYEYRASSHHIHADRRSSTQSLAKESSAGVFRLATIDSYAVTHITTVLLQEIINALAKRLYQATGIREVLFFDYLCYMISRDVMTESFREHCSVDPDYLSRKLGME
jgi:hypothetical protein